ncbi:hypothetical protein Pcinc_030265 [Petrolisthes cinctipes]|uniref:General transcription factor 3C polypeptide 1 n=1 Tax=Petrolisthes cinctipes TaxID=88211 RepID=A0AAE1EZ78_PETCI|nr:hypothetical protein Pcinc_030265 [Petrolisthes cinctipes]
MATSNFNYIQDLEDEIALEGLDGITIEGLWVRLKHRPNFETNMSLDDNSKAFLWSIIARDEEVQMFQLEKPRGDLVIFNRYELMDPELGIVLEPEEIPTDLYPYASVDDPVMGLRGSCKDYHTRKDITDTAINMTLQQVIEKYGNKLVLVASQQLRNKALCISTCIDKFYDLTLIQYIMLERIGRSRRMGEITQGKVSLACMGENPKSMFYHRKRLLKLNLITKQPHQQKGPRGQTHNGSLLHLTRFYVERRSKFIMMIQRAVEILKAKPEHCSPYLTIMKEMSMPEPSCRKLFKSAEFQRYVKPLSVPFRQMYPDAPTSQWKCKGKDSEKFVRIMQLIHPNVDPLEVCKVDEVVEDEEEEETFPGILNQSNIVWREGLLQQAYRVVEAAGADGVSQSDMAKMLGQTKLDSRTICRNLQRRNTVHSLMKDVGRQRVSRYVSHKFASTGHLTQEFRKERQKMMAMIEQANNEESKPSTSNETEMTSHIVESNHLEGVEVNLEMVTSLKNQGSSGSSKLSLPTKKSTDSKKSQSGREVNSLGFVSLLEKIRLTYNNQKQGSPHITTRMMKRANMIIEAVRSLKVIDDAFKLQKMIVQAETDEGYPVKMDKKSLDRLLDKLSKGGFLKNIIVKLKCDKMVKVVKYVVHPSITFDNPHLKSTIEQQKLKFLAAGSESSSKKESGSADKKQESSRGMKAEDRGSGGKAGGEGGGKDVTAGGSSSATTSGSNILAGTEDEPMNISTVGESMEELKLMHQVMSPVSKSSPNSQDTSTSPGKHEAAKKPSGSVKGSKGAKFVRMSEMHKLLFYLVYGYQGQEGLDQEGAWNHIKSSVPDLNPDQQDLSSYPTIYCPELSWRMFIPPLPNHMNRGTGWAFVCDVLLRLPLCIFVRLVNVSYSHEEIEAFLEHPIKKNILVKFLPPQLRQMLLQGRKYVTHVIDLINRLCYVGLLQYGHQIMKEKDQVFIFVNRRASLIDTTTSGPGYHQISADKEYVRKEYYFNFLRDVVQYWYDMWTISMHTPLGGHNCVQGKKITIQILDRKPQIMESLTPRKTTEAPARDTGVIPGDGRGAAGLDSAIFAHLKRNWSSTTGPSAAVRSSAILPPPSTVGEERSTYEGSASYSQYLMNTTHPSSDTFSPKHRLAGLRNVKLSVYKPRLGNDGKTVDVHVGLVTRQPRGRKRKKSQSSDDDDSATPPAKTSRARGHKKNRPTSYQRELKMRKKPSKKPYYDEEDRAALRRMNKLRVDWSSAEDSFLLLCKVASCFLFPNLRSQMITFSLVRDLLHERFPEARNKTSRACQRRINYIMKNPTTEDNVAIFLEEVRQDASIVAEFKSPRVPRSKKNLEDIYSKLFRQLMSQLVVKFASSESRQCLDLPDSTQEFEERYQVIMAASSLRNKLKVQEVKAVEDIHFHVVSALIYSSLCSKFDKDSYAYQLYLAYQQFPQALLNSVLTRMRKNQMISYKKCYNRSTVAQTCLPLSTSPFQLSVTYQHTFNFRYQYEIFSQTWSMLKQLMAKKHEETVKENSCTEVRTGAEKESEECSHDSNHSGSENNESSMIMKAGLPIVIQHEGGYCAALVALMATKRLIFDIVIPEQIIMMDQQPPPPSDDPHHSILQRFSDHTQLSGRAVLDFQGSVDSPASPSAYEPGDITPKTQETHVVREKLNSNFDADSLKNQEDEEATDSCKRKAEDNDKSKAKRTRQSTVRAEKASSSQSEESKLPTKPQESEHQAVKPNTASSRQGGGPARKASQRLKDRKSSMSLKAKQETVQDNDNEDTQDTEDSCQPGDVSSDEEDLDSSVQQGRTNQVSASRLGLYMMRDQLALATVDKINIQHAQELMVVNACEITCRLRPPPHLQQQFDQMTDKTDFNCLKDVFLPISKTILTQALDKRKRVMLDLWCTLEEVLEEWAAEGKSPELLEMVNQIYQYVHSCKELGASINDLKDRFSEFVYSIASVMVELEEVRVLVRVGVAVVRWVTVPYSRPWLIHTTKMTRGNRQSVRLQGVYRMNLNSTDKNPDPNSASDQLGDDANKNIGKEHHEDGSVDESELHSQQEDHEPVSGAEEIPASLSTAHTNRGSSEADSSTTVIINDDRDGKGITSGNNPLSSGNIESGEGDVGNASVPINIEDSNGCGGPSSSTAINEGERCLTPDTEESGTTSDGVGSERVKVEAGVSSTCRTSRRSKRISKKHEGEMKKGESNEEEQTTRHIHSFMAMRKRLYKKDEEESKGMERVIKQHHNVSEYEEISVGVRPWVRLNGTLNRRVVDRMLGSVLCLVMERPGISGQDVVRRFSPSLQAAHTHELLDTLVQIQCVVRQRLLQSHAPSLFSPTVEYMLVETDAHDCDDEVLYEPTVDAVLKLAMFIGDKNYTQDFLSGDRR